MPGGSVSLQRTNQGERSTVPTFCHRWAIAAKSIEAGLLLPVLEDWSPEYPGLCLYYPSRRNIPARLRAFIDLIRQQAR